MLLFVVAIEFSSRPFSFLLIAVYAAPSIPISSILNQISQLLLATNARHAIIAGDFNAKCPLWGGAATDAPGAEVMQFLASHSLVVINDLLSQPTFSTDYSEAWIDLTIFTQSLSDYAAKWSVCDSPTLSDRRYMSSRCNRIGCLSLGG